MFVDDSAHGNELVSKFVPNLFASRPSSMIFEMIKRFELVLRYYGNYPRNSCNFAQVNAGG